MKIKIGGLVENQNLTLYRMTSVMDQPGTAGDILNAFATNDVNLEYITESSTANGYAVMAICVNLKMSEKIDKLFQSNPDLAEKLNIIKEKQVSIIGIYGPHFREKPRLAAGFCQNLGKAGINILGLSSSISSICAVILNKDLDKARDTILEVFELP